MRNTVLFLSLAAGLAIACASSASAAPINAAAVKEVATTASQVQPGRDRRYYRRYGWGWATRNAIANSQSALTTVTGFHCDAEGQGHHQPPRAASGRRR